MAKPRAVRFLIETVQQHRPSLVFLSETLVKKNKIVAICKEIHFAGFFSVDAERNGGVLALL